MTEYDLHFSIHSETDAGKFRLMELPSELVTYIQDHKHEQLTIRGRGEDDAVLCTQDRTYGIRAVTLSNAVCVLSSPGSGDSGEAVIRDNVQQILELAPTIPKLHRLNGLLKSAGISDDLTEDTESFDNGRTVKRMRMNYVHVKAEVQASDSELERGLRRERILNLDGRLRPVSQEYLSMTLELILNTLVSLSLSPRAAPVPDLVETLQSDHEIPRDVCLEIMSWFGEVSEAADQPPSSAATVWRMDVDAVVKQIGIGILSAYRDTPIAENEFAAKWRIAVGDSFEKNVDMALLSGYYIQSASPFSDTALLTYFPSTELPIAPQERFNDLFLTRPRWKAVDIAPFLIEIAIDSKERDKLLMKYARSTADKDGIVWYTARGGTVA